MNKMELIMRVAEKTTMPQKQVKRCLDGILATIGDELKGGREVVLPDFGKFICVRTAARKVRLPNGRWTVIPVTERPRFKAFTNIRHYSVKYF